MAVADNGRIAKVPPMAKLCYNSNHIPSGVSTSSSSNGIFIEWPEKLKKCIVDQFNVPVDEAKYLEELIKLA